MLDLRQLVDDLGEQHVVHVHLLHEHVLVRPLLVERARDVLDVALGGIIEVHVGITIIGPDGLPLSLVDSLFPLLKALLLRPELALAISKALGFLVILVTLVTN